MTRQVRCGWCNTGNCDGCAVSIQLNHGVYYCPCDCNITGAYSPKHPRTRCIDCRRRNVPVDHASRCVDPDECAAFIVARREASPVWQAIQGLNGEPVEQLADPSPRVPRRARATHSECLCCGEPTRGGRFQPGHDARYVSTQAGQFWALAREQRDPWLLDQQGKLSNHLYAKLVKRIEAVRPKEAA